MDETTNDSQGEQKIESQAPPLPPPPATYPLFDVIAICNFAPAPPPLPSDNKIAQTTTKHGRIGEEKEASSYSGRRSGHGRQNVGSASRNGHKASPSATTARKQREELGSKGEHERRQRPQQSHEPPVPTPRQPQKTSSIADKSISKLPSPTAGSIQLQGTAVSSSPTPTKNLTGTTSEDVKIPSSKTSSPRTRGKHLTNGVSGSISNSPRTSVKKFDDDKRILSSPRDTISRINVDTNTKSRSAKISARKCDDRIPASHRDSHGNSGTVLGPEETSPTLSNGNILGLTQSLLVQKPANAQSVPGTTNGTNEPQRSILKRDSTEESSSEESSSSEDNTPAPATLPASVDSVDSAVANQSRSFTDLVVVPRGNNVLGKDAASDSDDSSRIMPRRMRNRTTRTGRRTNSSNNSVGSIGSRDRIHQNSRSINFDEALATSSRSNSPTKYNALTMKMMMSSNLSGFDPLKHRLKTTERGKSSIELMARKIENREKAKICITNQVATKFYKHCKQLARENGHNTKFHITDLLEFRERVIREHLSTNDEPGPDGLSQQDQLPSNDNDDCSTNTTSTRDNPTKKRRRKRRLLRPLKRLTSWQEWLLLLGLLNDEAYVYTKILELVDVAIREVDEVEGEYFYFSDFLFYNTRVLPKNVSFLILYPGLSAWVFVIFFYFASAILFCVVMQDEQICPADPTDAARPYYGWLTSIYFTSVTMSTVGYGDVNFTGGESWRIFIGSIFMLLSVFVGYNVFRTAGNGATKFFERNSRRFRDLLQKYMKRDGSRFVPLHQQIRILCFFRITELTVLFTVYVLTGVFATRIFIYYSDDPAHEMTWMTTFYFAVQTVTTVGYGDINKKTPFELRWFLVFYTTLGTAMVGSVFAGMANLKSELNDIRRLYAWKRREVSKRLIEDMKGGNSTDNKIDQFEFMVGSLLTLNKIQPSDVAQVMDQFRSLAGEKGYIMYSDAADLDLSNDMISFQEDIMDDYAAVDLADDARF